MDDAHSRTLQRRDEYEMARLDCARKLAMGSLHARIVDDKVYAAVGGVDGDGSAAPGEDDDDDDDVDEYDGDGVTHAQALECFQSLALLAQHKPPSQSADMFSQLFRTRGKLRSVALGPLCIPSLCIRCSHLYLRIHLVFT
jgi:hypothetical protein